MRGWFSRSAAVVIAIALVVIGAQPASADGDRHGPGGHHQEHQYLALGDSVPFGFDPAVIPPVGAKYFGYPEKAAPKLKLALTNASCPGQTSSGFISRKGTDNGCFAFRKIPGAMHTSYYRTQLDYAVSFLRWHPETRLVTISLGANDLLLICAVPSSDQCTSGVPGVLADYERNLTKILKSIRRVYDGKLVAVTYYSTNYADPFTTGAVAALNAVESRVVQTFGGTTADGFAAFGAVAAGFGGQTCKTGLLIGPDSNGVCNIHPSPAGAKLLADTLIDAVHSDPVYQHEQEQEDSLVGAGG